MESIFARRKHLVIQRIFLIIESTVPQSQPPPTGVQSVRVAVLALAPEVILSCGRLGHSAQVIEAPPRSLGQI